jgi:manganese/zinc/iron transport system permease protein
MSILQIEIQWIAVVTAAACAIPGVFLVLRHHAMMSDAISHTALLGIVLAFFLVQDLNSPILVLGAAAVGLLTVSLVALLERTRLVKEDAAIGLVFPALFSVAVILISRYAGDVHLDTDAVLIGELAFAPFDRLVIIWQNAALDLGPRGLWVMGGILLLNVLFISLFYKELKLSTFDIGLAASLGFLPTLLHYALMGLVSITIVGAFDVVGSVLVVALITAPAVIAYLLTDRLLHMLLLSALIGAVGAVGGYWLAFLLDASIAGSIATMLGGLFFVAYLFAPRRGVIATAIHKKRQKEEFAVTMLTGHLLNHENVAGQEAENRLDHLGEHLRWPQAWATSIVRRAQREGVIRLTEGQQLELTHKGRQRAVERVEI